VQTATRKFYGLLDVHYLHYYITPATRIEIEGLVVFVIALVDLELSKMYPLSFGLHGLQVM
jgi:hypothetical protein